MSEPLNLLDPALLANPWPRYAELRSKPVCQVEPNGTWVISRYDDILAVLKHPNITSTAWSQVWLPPWLKRNPLAQSMIAADPPKHTRLRSLVNTAFTGPALARLETRIQMVADVLAEQSVARGEVDFVSDFALALPAHVMGELLGLAPSMHPHLKHWSDDLMIIPSGQILTPDQTARIQTSIDMLEHHVREVAARRRSNPGDDMISDLVNAEVDGQRLTDDEVVSFGILLVMAGMETTISLLTQCMRYLSEHPDVFEQVSAQRGRLIPNFIEEILRYEPPITVVFRWTSGPVDVRGTVIPPGSMVTLLTASGLHDETHFPDPETFRLDRTQSVSLVFGHGPHFCLGAMLARTEARLGLQALLMRIRSVRRGPGELTFPPGFLARNPINLPVVFEPK
ncbi:MAG TPA: cytochrome P450 [Myxococcaceae bacterium]|nr:cytochrome P450 [Myxococcaceae bacterium]